MSHSARRWVLVAATATLLATPVTAAASTGSIAGTVTDGIAAPVDGAEVQVWNASGGLVDATVSDIDGTWAIGGLPNGTYKVRVGDFGIDHDWTYFGGSDWASAAPIAVAGAAVTDIDVTVPGLEDVKRVAGADRYRTGAAISEDALVLPTGRVYVASGLAFPDALAGGPGGTPGSPILLVDPNAVPGVTRTEIERLAPDEIVILGGPGAVSPAVETELATLAPVRRLAGADRFATAAAISADEFPSAVTVFLANGLNFPDALAGGAAAGHLGAPILLVTPTALPAATRAELIRLDPLEIVVLGGVGAVSDAVAADAATAVRGVTIRRLAGADRFSTAAEISRDTFFAAETVYVANGFGFPDALAGSPAAIWRDAPLLLVTAEVIPTATRNEIERLGPTRIIVLGGAAVISDAVATELATLVAP